MEARVVEMEQKIEWSKKSSGCAKGESNFLSWWLTGSALLIHK